MKFLHNKLLNELEPTRLLSCAARIGSSAVGFAERALDTTVSHIIQPTIDQYHVLQGRPTYRDALHKSRIDQLTDCYNRGTFIEKLDSYKSSGETDVVLAFVDLVGLREFNNNPNLGQHVGDAALVAFSWTIKEYFQEDTLAGRLGGDEFVVALKPGDKESKSLNSALSSRTFKVEDAETGEVVKEHRTDVDLSLLLKHEDGDTGLVIPENVKDCIALLLNSGINSLSARYNFQHLYFTQEDMGVQFGRFLQAHGQKYSRKTRQNTV